MLIWCERKTPLLVAIKTERKLITRPKFELCVLQGYRDVKQKISTHKLRTNAAIDHMITTRRAGTELLKRVGVVQMEAGSVVAGSPHVRLVLVQQMQHLQDINIYDRASVVLRTGAEPKICFFIIRESQLY